jgi:hypothetical protein
MAGIKTGIGGFEIDGKIHDFDVGDPNSPGDPKLPLPDSGDIKVDNDKKDISKGTRTTLSQYLKGVTAKNRYPNDGTYKEAKITDENGVPHALSDSHINESQFTDRPNTSGVSVGSTGDPATKLGNLSKGKKSPLKIDGHKLLHDVKKDSVPEPIQNYTSAILKNNRFSASSQLATEISGLVNDAKPSATFNPKLRHPRYGEMSMGRLAQVGTALSLRASQELNSSKATNNPTGGAQEAAALLPGINQLGASKVNVVLLEARDVLETLTSKEAPSGTYTNISESSWGALNNVDDQWSGITALGMIALSVALTAAITLLFSVLGTLFGLIKGSSGSARNISGRYVLGRNHVTKNADPNAFPPALPPDIGALLGLKGTVFPFSACVSKGTKVFFGIDDSGGLLGALTSGLKSAAQTPGYNSIVARTIIRSSLTVIESFKKAASSANLIATIKNVLNIIDVIRTSKLIAAANVFAMIGDLTLTDPGDQVHASDGIAEEPVKKSRMDGLSDDTNQASVSKNRLKGSIKLAWASNRAPSIYLLPDSVLTMAVADNTLGGFKGAAALSDDKSKTKLKILSSADANSDGARISRNGLSDDSNPTVEAFENALDAEYVPFSFHDLRTNEIISFHAFLASLNDDYTANYETVDAYGRVDPVKIYKSTHRKIGMSFYVVATSEHDFDDMWVKINKLVTLLYPQYTRGRMLNNSDVKFVQPFSQLIGASPMIRIRLGDLFRSNYSRFALARLFGLGGSDVIKLGSGVEIQPFAESRGKLEDIKKALLDPKKNAEFTIGSDQWPKTDSGGLSLSISPPFPLPSGTGKPKQAPTLFIDMNDAPYVIAKIVSVDNKSITPTAKVKIKLMTASEIISNTGMDETEASKLEKSLKHKYENDDNVKHKIVGSEPYQIPLTFLKPTQKTINDLFKESFGSDVENIEKISDFLDFKTNALVRSFNSIQGKGLAGVIESMNFDWYDKATWETLPGSTAPKMCKITLSYAPIHDISPGIDHMGYNRAPLYPVGSAMKTGKDFGS